MARLGFLVFLIMSVFFAWFHQEIAYVLDLKGISGKMAAIPAEKFVSVDRTHWQVHEVSSFEKWEDEGLPKNAWDGNPETFWHTAWKEKKPKYPHYLSIDMGRSVMVYAVTYQPRQGAKSNGRIKEYRIQLSEDGKKWRAVADGAFIESNEVQTVRLKRPTTGHFLRVDALSELNGKIWASIAELEVLTIE